MPVGRVEGESPYSGTYYGRIHSGALRSAKEMVPAILEYVQPSSVVDVGCGSGAWLSAFIANGVRNVRGIDGAWVDPENLPFPSDRFLSWNLTSPLEVEETFDLVLCLEVAEHLNVEHARHLIESLVQLGPVVLFSAAIPGQGGNNHVNEQWPEYWARLFSDQSYRAVDCLRMRIWDNAKIDWWYRQNTIFYVAEDTLARYSLLQAEGEERPPYPEPLIHPRLQMWFDWEQTRDHLQNQLNEMLPRNATVVIIDQERLGLRLDQGRLIRPFQQQVGVPMGSPEDDRTAVTTLDRLLDDGAEFLVLPWTADWWMDFYPQLMRRLSGFDQLESIEAAWVFRLEQGT